MDQDIAVFEQGFEQFWAIVVTADDNAQGLWRGLRNLIRRDDLTIGQHHAASMLQIAPQRAAWHAKSGETRGVEMSVVNFFGEAKGKARYAV